MCLREQIMCTGFAADGGNVVVGLLRKLVGHEEHAAVDAGRQAVLSAREIGSAYERLLIKARAMCGQGIGECGCDVDGFMSGRA